MAVARAPMRASPRILSAGFDFCSHSLPPPVVVFIPPLPGMEACPGRCADHPQLAVANTQPRASTEKRPKKFGMGGYCHRARH